MSPTFKFGPGRIVHDKWFQRRGPKVHRVDGPIMPFGEIWSGELKFEIRRADSDYLTGDTIIFHEFFDDDSRPWFSGRRIEAKVGYIAHIDIPSEEMGKLSPPPLYVIGFEVTGRASKEENEGEWSPPYP